MCTAYELGKRGGSFPDHVKREAIQELLGLTSATLIRPTLVAPVILPDGSLASMRWGFRRTFASKVKGRRPVKRTIVNSREDKLHGGMWKQAFQERRCLVPAAAFFEWVEVDGKKRPLRFERPGEEWIWIAGIWEQDEEEGRCFSMITTEPNAYVHAVHDRMPAVLSEAQITPYLDGGLQAFGPSSVELEFQETVNFLKRNFSSTLRVDPD